MSSVSKASALSSLVLVSLLSASLAMANCRNNCVSLVITVEGIRSEEGSINVLLTGDAQSFEEKNSEKINTAKVYLRSAEAKKEAMRFRFPKIERGSYAFKVVHDENDNKSLDRNILGIPTEGFSLSQQDKVSQNMMSFEKSKFNVKSNLELSTKLIYP